MSFEFINHLAETASERWPDQSEWCRTQYQSYVVNRAVLHGFPITLLVTMTCARYFECTTPLAAAAFATVNYILLTGSIEGMRHYRKIEPLTQVAIVIAFGILSDIVAQRYATASISLKGLAILTMAAFTGQLFRSGFGSED